jgi:hypothetical protein
MSLDSGAKMCVEVSEECRKVAANIYSSDATPPREIAPAFSETCSNKYELCRIWAFHGECISNPTFMKVSCQGACKTCGCRQEQVNMGFMGDVYNPCYEYAYAGGGMDSCRDSHPHCESLRSSCDSFSFLKSLCQLSCSVCAY